MSREVCFHNVLIHDDGTHHCQECNKLKKPTYQELESSLALALEALNKIKIHCYDGENPKLGTGNVLSFIDKAFSSTALSQQMKKLEAMKVKSEALDKIEIILTAPTDQVDRITMMNDIIQVMIEFRKEGFING